MANKYEVHMISLKMKGSDGCAVIFGKGENMTSEHWHAVNDWVRRMAAQPAHDDLDGSDLV